MRLPPPVAELIGLEVERVEGGETVMTLLAEERHSNPMGTLHGGILCDLADAAMGMAYYSTLEPGESSDLIVNLANYGTASVRARTYAADVYPIINGGFGLEAEISHALRIGKRDWCSSAGRMGKGELSRAWKPSRARSRRAQNYTT